LKIIDAVIDIKRDEWTAFAWAFCYFFFLLCAYYVLRPVRDEMGIQSGIKNLPWLWTGTFVGMLLITPLFGWISSKWPRRVFLPLVYFFFIANLVAFYFAFNTDAIPKTAVAPAFYVWISVFNYFVVSVFWSFMTDVFSTERAKRLFGGIAAGGSIGAMTGPTITAALVKTVGIPQLMLISATLLGLAVVCIYGLSNWARTLTDMSDAERLVAQQKEQALGGGMLDGIKLIFKSRYLLIICGYMILGQALGTYFYLEQLRVVSETIPSSAERTQLFAKLDLAVNSIALFIQLFITSALLKRLGLVFCLTALPAVGVLSLGWTALMPTLATIAICTVVRRAMEFAISKPAREILYTVVTQEERYKSKNVIDTIVSRGGDLIATWTHAGIRTFGHATSGMALMAIPFAILMVGTGVYLGRAQKQKEGTAMTKGYSENETLISAVVSGQKPGFKYESRQVRVDD
jgi:ATP:ADP antiporter, AAA family